MRTAELFVFMRERHSIYTRRAAGAPKPWTNDEILRKYRFCNVYRELDKVTAWIREHWREPHAEDQDLWFAMLIARMYNLPATLDSFKFPLPYYPPKIRSIRRVTESRMLRGLCVFSAAYMVRCDYQAQGRTKTDYLIKKVFNPAWKARAVLRPRAEDTLAQFHARLVECYGLGNFIAAQVVADTKFCGVLKDASDWWTWAAPGPGSLRGMNRLTNRDIKTHWEEDYWLATLNELGVKINVLAHTVGMPRISAQDLQNCLCEWDKYERARLGEGRPKQLYPGV